MKLPSIIHLSVFQPGTELLTPRYTWVNIPYLLGSQDWHQMPVTHPSHYLRLSEYTTITKSICESLVSSVYLWFLIYFRLEYAFNSLLYFVIFHISVWDIAWKHTLICVIFIGINIPPFSWGATSLRDRSHLLWCATTAHIIIFILINTPTFRPRPHVIYILINAPIHVTCTFK